MIFKLNFGKPGPPGRVRPSHDSPQGQAAGPRRAAAAADSESESAPIVTHSANPIPGRPGRRGTAGVAQYSVVTFQLGMFND